MINLKTLLFLVISTFFQSMSLQANSGERAFNDFVIDECPEDVKCFTSATSFVGVSYPPELNSPQVEPCYDPSYSQTNLMFEATSKEMELLLEWNPNESLRVGIVEDCSNGAQCIVGANCESGGVIELFTDELIIGHSYIVSIDNCLSSVNGIPLELTLTPGDPGEFVSITGLKLASKNECSIDFGDDTFCNGMGLVPVLEGENADELNHLFEFGRIWHFELSGTQEAIYEVEDIGSFEWNLTIPGQYTLELKSLELSCNSYDLGVSYNFEIIDVNEELGVFDVCAHELDNWTPGELWHGPELSEQGEYLYWFENECGCPYYQSIIVNQIEESVEEVVIELCPDDYPFEYFEQYELPYSTEDYDLMLNIEEGSLQEDWDREACDSLIHLFVINEKPEDRCSSCQLPLALEDGKIVYCVNFDNGTYDSSGKANRIEAIGVGYDNNGPASNRKWEAVFDGKDDHVRIPHFEDLNTSGFAIDIRFNKDEPFKGTYETILSKGDGESSNLRYRLGLQKQSETELTLRGEFYTENDEIIIEVPDLIINNWYGVTLVVESDSIGLYLDGLLHTSVAKTEPLRGNESDFYLATGEEDGVLTNFYEGRLDDFKYWKQKLSAQDILYLYYPEMEFEVYVDFFQTCCDVGIFRGVEISAAHPLDTIRVAEASMTGFDSVYYLRHILVGHGPSINDSDFFKDIFVEQSVLCDEVCIQSVSWEEPTIEMFDDACGIGTITSSHTSPIELDENMSYVEVVYSVSNECGDERNYSFTIEMNCIGENYESLPRDNDFTITTLDSCEEETDGQYCLGKTLRFEAYYIDEMSGVLSNDYSKIDSLLIVFSIRGNGHMTSYESNEAGAIEFSVNKSGAYEICFDRLESKCEISYPDKCMDIEIIEGIEIDYGLVTACPGSIEEVLPSEMSTGFREEVLMMSSEGMYHYEYENNCGCIVNESLILSYSSTLIPEEQSFTVCSEEQSIELLGELFVLEREYDQELITFPGASLDTDSNGMRCDSSILLTVNVLETQESYVEEQICEGSEHMGYSESGTYTNVLIGSDGCDSLVYLDLMVYDTTVQNEHISICPGESYMGYTEAGTYIETYINQYGCDSTLIIDLTLLDEEDEDCIVSNIVGIEELGISVYPNPTEDIIYLNCQRTEGVNFVKLFSQTGKLMQKLELKETQQIEVSNFPEGIYFLVISNENQRSITKIFVR